MTSPEITGPGVFVSSHWAMKLYLRQGGDPSFPAMSQWLRRLGVTAIEAGTSHLPEVFPAGLTPGETLLRERELGSAFLVHNAFPLPDPDFVLNLASPDETVRRASIEAASVSARAAAACGAPFYSLHCGFLEDPRKRDDLGGFAFAGPSVESPAEGLQRFLCSLSSVRATAPAGLKILVENSPATGANRSMVLLPDPIELGRVLEKSRIPETAILLDLGHLSVTAKTLGFRPLELLKAALAHAEGLHISVNDGLEDLHGDPGRLPWFMKALKSRLQKKPKIPIVLEFPFESPTELLKTVSFWNLVCDCAP